MPRLQCPRCETTIEAPETGTPVCPSCSFSAPYETRNTETEQTARQEPTGHAPERPQEPPEQSPPGYPPSTAYQPTPYGGSSSAYQQPPGPGAWGPPPGQQPAGHPPQPGQPQSPPRGETPGLAVASLTLGIIGLCFIFIIWIPVLGWISMGPAILAIIFGGIALSQMNKDPNLQGRGMALAGLVMGIIVAAIGLFFRVIFVGL
jgi:hypothetical protein